MNKVVTIYEAKTKLSQLVKLAQAGETIYIGAFGQPQAVLSPLPERQPVKIGIWADKRKPNAYELDDLVAPDADVTRDFDASATRALPE